MESKLIQVPYNVYQMWKAVVMAIGSHDQGYLQERLKGLIQRYVREHFPGHQITAFAEVGQQDQTNITLATGKDIERGFYLRLRPFPDELLWALEHQEMKEIVTNKHLQYEREHGASATIDEGATEGGSELQPQPGPPGEGGQGEGSLPDRFLYGHR